MATKTTNNAPAAKALQTQNHFFCRFCKICNGYGCIGQMPGMGGVNKSQNFILNCAAWNEEAKNITDSELFAVNKSHLGIAPVTGAEQNIGFAKEKDFYLPYFYAANKAGITVCVGDGAPDEKLHLGTEAVKTLGIKAQFFLKPYPIARLYERIDFIKPYALAAGIDIDAYNIVSMRNQAKLEKKSATQLKEFRKYSKLPLMIKGVFTKADVELCKEVLPEIIVVSNHGGRVETDQGSTKDFLAQYGTELKKYCGELWVDGGIRTKKHIAAAVKLGATKVLVARPFISALCSGGEQKMIQSISAMLE